MKILRSILPTLYSGTVCCMFVQYAPRLFQYYPEDPPSSHRTFFFRSLGVPLSKEMAFLMENRLRAC